MKFRECVNCQSLLCTVYKKCYLVQLQKVADTVTNFKQIMGEKVPVEPIFAERDPPCNDRHSSNGLCPCCGCELDRRQEPGSGGGEVQECICCDWESDIFYDW